MTDDDKLRIIDSSSIANIHIHIRKYYLFTCLDVCLFTTPKPNLKRLRSKIFQGVNIRKFSRGERFERSFAYTLLYEKLLYKKLILGLLRNFFFCHKLHKKIKKPRIDNSVIETKVDEWEENDTRSLTTFKQLQTWVMHTRFSNKKVELSIIYRKIPCRFVFFLNCSYKLSARIYILSNRRLSYKKRVHKNTDLNGIIPNSTARYPKF